MEFDGTAINAIAELQRAAMQPQLIPAPPELDGRYYFLTTDGSYVLVKPQTPSRDHVVDDLASFCAYACCGGPNSVVWFNRESITMVLDDANDRRDTVTLPLEDADQWETVQTLTHRIARNQSEMVRFLRIDLAGCLPDATALIAALRKLKFVAGRGGTGTIDHGSESLDRSIVDAVIGDTSIPEFVTLTVPIYAADDIYMTQDIVCAVDIQPADATMRIVPLPGQITDAWNRSQNILRKMLGNGLPTTCAVYRGRVLRNEAGDR